MPSSVRSPKPRGTTETEEVILVESSRAMADAGTSSSSPPVMRRRGSYGALGFLVPTSGVVAFSCEPPCEEEPRHSLDACALCRRPLGRYVDIFMYKGDTPFCSEDCRQEQIDLDLAREEEEAGYRRSRTKTSHRTKEPGAAAAQPQSIPARAAEAAVAG